MGFSVLNLFHSEDDEPISDLNIVEILKANPTLASGLDLAHILGEPVQ